MTIHFGASRVRTCDGQSRVRPNTHAARPRSHLRSLPGRTAYPFFRQEHAHQLEMVRPSTDEADVPPVPEGYRPRQFRPGDETAYDELFHLAFEHEGRLPKTLERALDDGFFVIEHLASGHLVASCVAERFAKPPMHPEAGELGWLVTDPLHTGRRLGTIVAASATNRLAAEGCQRPFLETDDFRVAAISIYLKLGWRPYLYKEGMEARWRNVLARLDREFIREECVALGRAAG